MKSWCILGLLGFGFSSLWAQGDTGEFHIQRATRAQPYHVALLQVPMVDEQPHTAPTAEPNLAAMIRPTVLFSLLLAVVEVMYLSKAGFIATFSGWFFIYTVLVTIGNLVATLAAAYALKDKLAQAMPFMQSPVPAGLMLAFCGVFAFDFLISRLDLTLYGKNVITLDQWIGKARTGAQAAAVDRQEERNSNRMIEIADELKKTLDDAELDTYAQQFLGADALAAAVGSGDPKLYKALTFASQKPREARAICRQKKKAKKT